MKREVTPTIDEELGLLIKSTQMVLNQRMDEQLRPLGLTVSQYACLQTLNVAPGITSSELARRTFVSRQSMNVLLQGLEKRGLIRRSLEAGPRRERAVALTTAGENAIGDAGPVIKNVVTRMDAQLNASEKATLYHLLGICHAALSMD